MKRKSIKIEEEDNLKYFFIYEVRAEKHNGEVITIERFLKEKDANNNCDFTNENLKKLYKCAWTRKCLVFC